MLEAPGVTCEDEGADHLFHGSLEAWSQGSAGDCFAGASLRGWHNEMTDGGAAVEVVRSRTSLMSTSPPNPGMIGFGGGLSAPTSHAEPEADPLVGCIGLAVHPQSLKSLRSVFLCTPWGMG